MITPILHFCKYFFFYVFANKNSNYHRNSEEFKIDINLKSNINYY